MDKRISGLDLLKIIATVMIIFTIINKLQVLGGEHQVFTEGYFIMEN